MQCVRLVCKMQSPCFAQKFKSRFPNIPGICVKAEIENQVMNDAVIFLLLVFDWLPNCL